MSKIRIEQLSIVDAGTDCIVNATNEQLKASSGVSNTVFKAAGWKQLQDLCDAIGHCDTGSAVATIPCNFNTNCIIHAVGPVWKDGKHKEPQKLYSCYVASLDLAKQSDLHSIAFPLISAGSYGYPIDKAWRIALQACNDFIEKNLDYDMDILFAVIDEQILQIGKNELQRLADKKKARYFSTYENELLLEKLDGKALGHAIKGVQMSSRENWLNWEQKDDKDLELFSDYSKEVWEMFSIFEYDYEGLDHYNQYCEGVLPTDMNVQQIRTMLTFLRDGEHSHNGFISEYLNNGVILKMLLRLDDLLIGYYQKHNLPLEMRYHNPLFWYEMDNNQNPVLIKGNGKKLTIIDKSEQCNKTKQSQQGWQRAVLFMRLNNMWDSTGFGATMSATFAYGPDKEGKCYTFTSCEQADRHVYAILTSNQVIACRKNVDNFYANPKLQMEWKDVILHPVCIVLREDGSLEPADIGSLNSKILELDQGPIQIGNKESYKWIFENY